MPNMTKYMFYLALAALVCLSGCTKEVDRNDLDDAHQLGVTPVIVEATKAPVSGTSFPTAGEYQVGVHVCKGTFGVPYALSTSTNVKVTKADGQDLWATEKFPLSATEGTVYGYYPYEAGRVFTATERTIPVRMGNSVAAQVDYMWHNATAPITVNSETSRNIANLTLDHAMTQVSFVVFIDDYSGPGRLTEVSLTNTDAATAAGTIYVPEAVNPTLAMDITTGAITGGVKGTVTTNFTGTAPGYVQLTNAAPADPLDRNMINAGMLLPPIDAVGEKEIKVTFTIDGISSFVHEFKAVSWPRGRNTVYKIRVKGTLLEVTGVDVMPWVSTFGGHFEVEKPEGPAPKIGDLKDGGIVYEVIGANYKTLSLEQGSSLAWASNTNNADEVSIAAAQSMTDGKGNQKAVVAFGATQSWWVVMSTHFPAFNYCDTYSGGGWFLPAQDQLVALATAYQANKAVIDAALAANGGTAMAADNYWSSTESGDSWAWSVFIDGSNGDPHDDSSKYEYDDKGVRCIKEY